MVYAQKVNTREELPERILSVAEIIIKEEAHTRWTREKNYPSEFSDLQETSTTLQCFVKLQVLWSHESVNVSKQTEDTSNNLFQCWTANL